MLLNHANYQVELIDVFDLPENKSIFELEHQYNKTENFSTKIFVDIKKEQQTVSKAILYGNNRKNELNQKSALVFDDMLVACVSDNVFCLELPSLRLKWFKEIDPKACLQVFKISESYLVHGENSVSRINFLGDVIWRFFSEAILITPEGLDLKFTAEAILVKDCRRKLYKLGYDGELI